MSKKVIAEILVNEWKLANGWTPARLLQEHFAGEQRFSKVASEKMAAAEARVLVAGITLDFVRDIANAMRTSVGSIIEVLKDSQVVKFFSKIGWSFKKLYDLLRKGYQTYKEIVDVVWDFASEIGARGTKWTNDQLVKLDGFVKKNSRLFRISGLVLGGLLAFLWFWQADTGDASFDFDASDITDALAGRFSFTDIFGGMSGLTYLVTLVMGVGSVSFPWPGAASAQFISAVLSALIIKFRVYFRKESPKRDEKIPALAV